MRATDQDAWLAGVDGCAGGWIVAFVRPNGTEVRQRILTSFSEILTQPEMPAIVAVDMPIGLPEHSPPKGRLAESAVRPLLGKRKSSVFRIPSRSAVYAGTNSTPTDDRERFFLACDIARKTSEDGKAFAKQGFYIFRKIVEIDQFLRSNQGMATRVFEIHPEVAFWRINGDHELEEPKKKKNRPYEPGIALRRSLLVADGFSEEAVNHLPAKTKAGTDDWLDALACAAIARRIHAGLAQPFPDPPPRDAFGLAMAIWA
jgi:predicted RNase H-like nuclease